MNLQQWNSAKGHAERLAEMLADPVMQRAFAVIRTAHEPSVPDRGTDLSGVTEELARRYAHRAGAFGVLTLLERMAHPVKGTAVPLMEWGTLVTDDLKEEPAKVKSTVKAAKA